MRALLILLPLLTAACSGDPVRPPHGMSAIERMERVEQARVDASRTHPACRSGRVDPSDRGDRCSDVARPPVEEPSSSVSITGRFPGRPGDRS
jgi:hypothetical protein